MIGSVSSDVVLKVCFLLRNIYHQPAVPSRRFVNAMKWPMSEHIQCVNYTKSVPLADACLYRVCNRYMMAASLAPIRRFVPVDQSNGRFGRESLADAQMVILG